MDRYSAPHRASWQDTGVPAPPRSRLLLAGILGLLSLIGALGLAPAQATDDQAAPRLVPAWAAVENAAVAHGQRFVDAVKALPPETPAKDANPSRRTAYVMIELAAPASEDRPVITEFRGIRSDSLATFYNEMCKGRRDAVEFHCPPGRFTISTTEDLPLGQACDLLRGLLLISCTSPSVEIRD